MEYHKLVRDKIPEIIKDHNEIPNIRILDDEEYTLALEQKLDEEVAEYHKDRNLEELADILEVVYALAENLGYRKEDLQDLCDRKRDTRGGFRDRIFLISKEG